MGFHYILLIMSQILLFSKEFPAYFITPHLEVKQLEIEPFSFDYYELNINDNKSFILTDNSGELKSNYGKNYQKLYGLRFDPNKLSRRNIKLTQSESNYELNDYPMNIQKINSSEIADDVEIFNLNPELSSEDTNEIFNDSETNFITTTGSSITNVTNNPEFSSQLPPITNKPEFDIIIQSNSTDIDINLPNNNETSFITDIEEILSNVNNSLINEHHNTSFNNTIPNYLNSTINLQPSFSNILNIVINRVKNLFSKSKNQNNTFGTTYSSPSSKLLNLFTIIKFENSECSTNFIRNLTGICYNEQECQAYGGTSMGPCAGGFGVCCVFKSSCDGKVNQKISYFESPNYPLPFQERLACILTVELRRNVKQLKLDFLTFELKRPTNGNCDDDQFIISGQSKKFKVPILCGVNTGQHIYVDVSDAADGILFFSLFTNNYGNRAFNFKITQLDSNFAPEGCLQYYTEQTGYIKSFNYDGASGVILTRMGSYMNNLNYAICIKREKNACAIAYSNEPNSIELQFQLVNFDEEGDSIIPDGQAGADLVNCPDDYITIASLRLCGNKLNDGRVIEDFNQNSVVTDYQNGPIIIFIHTNDRYVGRGFKLFYIQEYCG